METTKWQLLPPPALKNSQTFSENVFAHTHLYLLNRYQLSLQALSNKILLLAKVSVLCFVYGTSEFWL